ncbi:MAG: patatin-like phospholipase family protein [Phycisphaeraceae bacterium]|nr:patatin-like phospholipase family protein [Phycisphaerae bacterium]MBX3393510.1 patatin-like phospholipase family protein [Phycisphaeraceae bacterium]
MMLLAAAAMAPVVTAGCGAPMRPVRTDAQFSERSAADLLETRETFDGAVDSLLSRAQSKTSDAAGSTPTLDFLAMSGGGDYGAFGAGVLVGWGSISDPEWKRPDFDVVTGVSTGALLAPFAFVGTDEACMAVEHLYRHPKKDWLKDNGLLFFLPFNPSFMQIPGLERDIRAAIDRDMISRMAEQARKGKVLAISSTDLDLGRQKFWDVGAEAVKAVRTEDYEKVHRIMLASAAIPAIFPPIEIDDSIYGDGGVSANVFLRLDPRSPDSFVLKWKEKHPGTPLPRIRYWIVINNQLSHIPKTVQRKWPAVIGPSLEIAIRSATLAEVRWLAAEADYTNVLLGTNIEVRVLAIPDDWRPPVEGQFQQETMQSLARVGRSLGETPGSWKLLVTPEMSRGRR